MTSNEHSRILVFTGDGKGKTTAALGIALRALGHGFQTKIIQFIKSDPCTGELTFADNGITVVQTGLGFVPKKSHKEFADHVAAARKGVELAREALLSVDYPVVVLDEICNAIALGLLEEQEVIDLVAQAPKEKIVVLTGRNASRGLLDIADTVTEMTCIKHGYQTGIKAQKGVEF
jgi:cob(I)alamin adenosyltransferase